MTRSVLFAFAVIALAAALVIANPWRREANRSPADSTAATSGLEDESRAAGATAPVVRDTASPSSTAAPVATTVAEASRDAEPADQDIEAVIEGIDPLLAGRNVIMRAPESGQTAPGFGDLEGRFDTEAADVDWAPGMAARILDEMAQVAGLKLVSLEAECRATICRVKLFHPSGTNPLTSVDHLQSMATNIGFEDVVHAATLGENRVPMSVLYFLGSQVSADSTR